MRAALLMMSDMFCVIAAECAKYARRRATRAVYAAARGAPRRAAAALICRRARTLPRQRASGDGSRSIPSAARDGYCHAMRRGARRSRRAAMRAHSQRWQALLLRVALRGENTLFNEPRRRP